MKIIPKFQGGGGIESLFTTYVPVQAPQQPRSVQTSQLERSSRQDSDDDKGKLTEKDFYAMLKNIDGLPNEMQSIVSNLIDTLSINKIAGIELSDLSTIYLQSLYRIRQAVNNKKQYDEAWKRAIETGAMSEPAITVDGKLVIQDKEGYIRRVSLEDFMSNRDQYKTVLTVSNLLNSRAYEPSFANDSSIFDTVNSSIGYQSFQKLIKEAVHTLGSTQVSREGIFSNEGQASKGLALLQTLKEQDQIQPGTSITSEGLYKYKIIDKNQKRQIDELTSYISALLPENAKVWAALKLETSDREKATASLITTYLSSGENTTNEILIEPKSTEGSRSGSKSSSGTSKEEDPKKGFWSQVQSGQGGEDFRFALLTKKGSMSIDGKFYGTTPGLDSNKSLGDYINNSKVGYLIKNNKNITFGDKKISVDSFNDVMVNAYSGAAVVTLPIKVDGTVDLNIAERWTNVLDQLEDSGLNPNTPEYNQKWTQLLAYNQLDGLIDSNGNLNRNRFGQFLVLEGYTSEKASAVQDNKKVSFKDVQSDFILPAGDDGELYNMIKQGLSNKDRGEYEISDGWLFSDELFKGNVYIPLNTNPINGYNADSNQIKESTSYLYEKAQQQYSTNSSDL